MTASPVGTVVWRETGVAALIGGAAWVAFDLVDRLSSQDRMSCSSVYGYLQAGVDTVAFLAMVPTLIGLFVAYRRSGKGWFGVTAIIAAVGYAMAGISNILEHCFTGTITVPFPLLTGFAEASPWVIGLSLSFAVIPFTLALTRVWFLPNWLAWLLVMGSILSVARANQGGFIVFGASLIVLGIYLLTHRQEPMRDSDDARSAQPREKAEN